jgi:hypothetical protein
MKRKYDKVVLTFVLDGRNKFIRNTNEDGIVALMNSIQKTYCVIDNYHYSPENIQLFVRDGINQKVVMVKQGRKR